MVDAYPCHLYDIAQVAIEALALLFNEVKAIWQSFESAGMLTQAQEDRLAEIERRDGVFPSIDPGLWVAGAKQERIQAPIATTA